MNYEQISQMTFAELRALEYDLNRVKCYRSGFLPTTPEKAETDRAFHINFHADHDADNQVRWDAKLRKRELDRQLAERKNPKPVVFVVVDAYDSEDEPIGNIVRQNAVVGRKAKTAPPKPKTYFIPDVLWNFVKEYAGIYNYHINWNKKWSDISSHYALREHCPSVDTMTQNAFCKLGKENPEAVRKMVWKDLNRIRDVKDWKGDIIGNTRELTLKNLEYLAPLFHLPTWCVVGVDVMWYRREYANDQTKCCGKVKKITDKNITIDVYNSVATHSTSTGEMGADVYTHYNWVGKDKTTTFSTDKGFKPRGNKNGWTYCLPYN